MGSNEKSWFEIVVMLAVSAAGSVWTAYVMSIMWAWFMVAGLGAMPLRIPVAGGVVYTAWLLQAPYVAKDKETQAWGQVIGYKFLLPLLCLGCGWVWHQFV